MADRQVLLVSSDGESIRVPLASAKASRTIKTMLEDLGIGDNPDEEISLPNVTGPILRKIVKWANHHKDDPPPPEEDPNTEKRTDDISHFDAELLKVDQSTIFEIILAANYLDIQGLLDTACKVVANMIKGKTPEEVRKHFNIINDFDTPAPEPEAAAAD
ncbi:hypothetical protein HPB50_014269 [Hyalomma asiaticum]|uniref:Uncharacterized protein n=1 Tax=Hyalomma asiaticum TaxID=266040 RepID=A0ACB7S3U4_HYAAI|nr:hypothetical protein HPB50_014269 [Hyalomma asiaticum]